MIIAVHANLERLFQFLLVEMLAAFFTAHKDILCADDALGVAHRLDLAFLFFGTRAYEKSEVRSQRPEVSN